MLTILLHTFENVCSTFMPLPNALIYANVATDKPYLPISLPINFAIIPTLHQLQQKRPKPGGQLVESKDKQYKEILRCLLFTVHKKKRFFRSVLFLFLFCFAFCLFVFHMTIHLLVSSWSKGASPCWSSEGFFFSSFFLMPEHPFLEMWKTYDPT